MSGHGKDHGQRLSALDGSFLRLESPQAHMHVGWSAVLSAPVDAPRPTAQALRERAACRLHQVPWCRWRLESTPLALSEPRWVDDPDFDLSERIVDLTDPDDRVSPATLAALCCDVLSTPLDRSQPLWQIFVIPCLEDGRVAMVGKIHHALVDGIAALQIVGLVADVESGAESESAVDWQPNDRARPLARAVDALTDAAGEGFRVLQAGVGASVRPRTTIRGALEEMSGLVRAVHKDVLPRAPDSGLNVEIGARRTLVGYRASRADLRAARAGGGTLNDVGLAVVAGALRELALRDGGEFDAPLKVMIPVSMRRADEFGAGNRISMVYIHLPIHLDSPRKRIDWVRRQTRQLKHSERAAGTETLYRIAALLPTPLRSPAAKALSTPRVFNLTISQPPGPRRAVHMLGCELEEVYSAVPITEGHALSIGMVRYNRELFFGCYADPDALPAVDELPALLESELHALGAAASASAESDQPEAPVAVDGTSGA
ncbi:MAG: wax ester/triacylglycerol synthase family O-acyltransferase [Actinomycetota bacterium]|nr:wax ester/triacylglycerol synthase family O-acyltransferase [Actinomycetota bacterium]